jgi:hypothetical protein
LNKMDNNRKDRSLFWPVVLIGVGVIWLLYNLDLITGANITGLFQLWPLLLIGAGLDLLFGRRYPVLGALFGLAVVTGLIAMTLAGPRLGLVNTPEMQTETFVAPSGLARRAKLDLQLSSGRILVQPLSGTENLLVATAVHSGSVQFEDSGTTNRTIRLNGPQHTGNPFVWFNNLGEQKWDIAISQDIPVDIDLVVSSGTADIQLTGLKMETAAIRVSSGDTEVRLPATGKAYPSSVSISSGSLLIHIPDGAETAIDSQISSGRLTYDVPSSSPVRFEVTRKSSGNVRLPSRFQLVQGDERGEGVWEAPGTDPSAPLIEISVGISSGSVIVR